MIVTFGFGKNPITWGYGRHIIEEIVRVARTEILRLSSKISKYLRLESKL